MSKDKYPTILGDPGAASQAAPCKQNPFLLLFSVIRIKAKRNERGSARRVVRTAWHVRAKFYLKGRRAPENLLLLNQFQKFLNLCSWLTKKIFFWPIREEVQPGNVVAFLHDVGFFFDWHVPSEDSLGEFQKKDTTKPRKWQTLTWVLGNSTEQLQNTRPLHLHVSVCFEERGI